jgi:hypothetical protein
MVTLQKTDSGYQLLRNGAPYFIRGAGGDGDRALLVASGGNSIRTWGVDDAQRILDDAHAHGLTVALGFWMGHERHGFKYDDKRAVQEQLERARAAVLKFKDHPALLLWAFGNEMEGFEAGANPQIWLAVEELAAMAKALDPNHPRMTVMAELGGKRVVSVHRYCPSIDIVGINTYGGGPSVAARYRELGGTKPFILTEYGPNGTWEVGKTAWKAALEPTSTQKAAAYRATYEATILREQGKLCLGSYAFIWGHKREATATWYGMLLRDGSRLEAVETLAKLWGGKPPEHPSPKVEPLVADKTEGKPGETVFVTLHATSSGAGPLRAEWILEYDLPGGENGGDAEPEPPAYPAAIVSAGLKGATLKLPPDGGGYRLLAIVRDSFGGAATATLPLHVVGARPRSFAKKASLPLVVYRAGLAAPPYASSGWMGNTAAIALDPASTEQPRDGHPTLKCAFRERGGWGGVVWQSPANDWGKQPGGYDLTGAKRLTFWVRGAAGGEKVSFKLGLLGDDVPFKDSASAALEATLTAEWKQYALDVAGLDLSCIKTGFSWTVAARGEPVVFYLDDVQYE